MYDSIVLLPLLAIAQNREESREAVQGEWMRQDQGTGRWRRNRGEGENVHPLANFALLAQVAEHEPETLTEVLNSEAKAHWKQAWESELRSLVKNNTWVLEPLPIGRSAIGWRWLFQRKQDGQHEARLVAKEYSQRY